MIQFRRYFILTLFLILSVSPKLFSQFSVQGNVESGFYKSMGDFLSKESDLIIALEGKLDYRFEHENTEASFELKTRPEWFGLKKDLLSFKFRGSGDFLRREENFDWGIGVTRHLNRVSGGGVDINYDIFSVQGNTNFYLIEDLPVSIILGYAYQNIGSSIQQNHDIVFVEGKAHGIYNPYFRAGYGLYIEKFLIEGETITDYTKKMESSSGFRFGPELEINYLKDFVINGQYRFLVHSSDNTKFPSYEHWVRLVTGKFLFTDFSTFLLIDYYWRSIKNSGDIEKINILYSPFNVENQIYLKVSYAISDYYEIYLKGGYFRNDLVYNNYMFEGWNFLVGMELSN